MIHLPPLLQRTFPVDPFNSRLKPLTRRAYVIAFMLPNKRTSRFIAPFSSPKYLRKVRTAGPEPGHLEKYLQKNTSNRAKTGPNTSNRAKFGPPKNTSRSNTSNRAIFGPEKYLQPGQIRATEKYLQKKNTLPLRAGGRGASTTLSSWGLGPRGHAVVLPRQRMVWLAQLVSSLAPGWGHLLGGSSSRRIQSPQPGNNNSCVLRCGLSQAAL